MVFVVNGRTGKYLSCVCFSLGIVLLLGSVYQAGLAHIVQAIRILDGRIVLVLIFPVTWNLIQSWSWSRIVSIFGSRLSLRSAFLARLAGGTVSQLSPMSILAGEPYRAYIVGKSLSKRVSAASVIVDRAMQTLGIIAVLAVSVFAALFYLPLPHRGRIILSIIPLLLVMGIVGQLAWQRRGFLSPICRLIQKIGMFRSRLKALSPDIQDTDRLVSSFYQKKSHSMETATYHFLGRFLGVIEIYFIALLMGFPITFSQALFLTTLEIVMSVVFVFVPANMGVMEGGVGFLFYLLHLNPAHGVAIQLVRRIRQIFWTFLGLLIAQYYRPQEESTRGSSSPL